MLKNKYWRRTLSIAWPSVLESFFIAVAGVIDTLMVSSLGSNAVAAIGLTTQPKFIALAIFNGISVSVSALVARRKGEEDKFKANQTLLTAMTVAIILVIIISTFTVIFTSPIIKLSGSNSDTHKLAVSYMRIIMAGLIFNVISMTINAAQRGSGNTRIAFTTNVVSSITNIFLNFLLIGGRLGFPALGVRGAAIATVTGTAVAAMMSISSLFRKISFVSLPMIVRKKIGFSKIIAKNMTNLATNIFAENLAARVGFLITAVTAAHLGTKPFAAHNVGMNILSLSFAFGDGMQVASVALTGNALGAKKKNEAIKYGNTCQRVGLTISAIISFIIFVFRKDIFKLFFDDPSIIKMGSTISFFIIFIVLFQISQVIFGGCLRAAGDVRFTLISSLISITFIRSISTLVSVHIFKLGLAGIWIGVLVDQMCRYLILRWRFKQGKWVNRVI